MLCPICKIKLEPISYRQITIDKCPKCSGVWLDKGEEDFVKEIIQNANQAACRDCQHFQKSNKHCIFLKIFTSAEFSCSNFTNIKLFQ